MSKVHLSLNVRDLGRSVRFYSAFLGCQPRKLYDDYANFDVDSPALRLALVHKPGMERGEALNHLGILVESVSEVEAAKQRLIEAGLATFTEEDAECCYAIQTKVWAHDPDGNAWEVYMLLEDVAPRGQGLMSLAVVQACCEN